MSVTLLHGDCRTILPTLPEDSFDCCVTSPPYFGLRDYGVDGQIGLEPTLQEYVETLVGVFDEVRRVLKPSGTCWLNLGDSYASQGGPQAKQTKWQVNGAAATQNGGRSRVSPDGLKPKDLIGAPWRVAFALQERGWWLRSSNIWSKPNGMPESTRDRPTVSHEYVFQLSKSETYYYGYDDVKLPAVPESVDRLARAMRANLDGEGGFIISGGGYDPPGQTPHSGHRRRTDKQRGHSRRHNGFNDRWDLMSNAEQRSNGAALRSVWTIATAGNRYAHFAVMPDELAAICVLAGCPSGGHVLDPFGGAGTTGLIADRLGRNATLIELNPDYGEMQKERIVSDAPLLAVIT